MILSDAHPLDRPAPFARSPAVLRDPGADHQIVLGIIPAGTAAIYVSCNCLRYRLRRRQGPWRYRPLGVRSRWELGEAMGVWRAHMAEVAGG